MYVNDLDLFVTVQLLDDTHPVLSLGNSSKITDIPVSGLVVHNHILLETAGKMFCRTENYLPICVLGLSTGSSSSTASTSSTSVSQNPVRDDSTPGPTNTRSRRKRRRALGDLLRVPKEIKNKNTDEDSDQARETHRETCRNRGVRRKFSGRKSLCTKRDISQQLSRAASSRTFTESGAGKSIVFSLTFQRTEIAKYAKGPKNTRPLCRKRTGNQVPRAGQFG